MVLDTVAQVALDSAIDCWRDTERAWEAVEWAIARDPLVGLPLSESGKIRGFVYDGARSIGQPDIQVIYEIATRSEICVRSAQFSDAKASQAGRA